MWIVCAVISHEFGTFFRAEGTDDSGESTTMRGLSWRGLRPEQLSFALRTSNIQHGLLQKEEGGRAAPDPPRTGLIFEL